MSPTRYPAKPDNISPTRLFLIVLGAIFVVEVVVMVALPWVIAHEASPVLEMIVDSSLLTLVVSPILWWLIIIPLRRLLQLRTELLAKVIDAQEEERARISRDLHDGVGQALASLRIGLKAAENSEDLETLRTRCRELRAIAASTHEDVGRLARGLRPAVLDDLGLSAALERLTGDMGTAYGFSVVLNIALGATRFDPHAEIAIFRIAQEALTNVGRHAEAKNVAVSLLRNGDTLELCIEDDGKGFDRKTASSGLGLSGIRQRTELLGGSASIESRSAGGAKVVARIPAMEIGHGEDTSSVGR